MIQAPEVPAPTSPSSSNRPANISALPSSDRLVAHATLTSSPLPVRRRLLIVDDHSMLREHLAQVIQAEPDLTVCGEAEDCGKALEVIDSTKPDLAIVDLSLRNSSGLDLLNAIGRQHPYLKVLVLSMHDELLHADRVLRAGARGYITKQEATRKILLAVRTVLGGGIYVSGRSIKSPS